MERWEPPKPTGKEAPRRRRPAPEAPAPRELPEIWLMVAMRAGISLIFVLTVLFDDLRDLMGYVVVVMTGALIVVMVQSDNEQMQRLRRQTMVDAGILLTVVPLAVLYGFVSAEPGSLLPAEHSALLQTGGGLLIILGIVIWFVIALFPHDRAIVPAILLPALVTVVALTFVLHDYRNQTVLAMLAVSYFIGAAAVALGALVDEPVRRHVPAVFFASTIIAGLALFDPGLRNVFERDGLVQMLNGLMILIGVATLVVLPNPVFDDLRLGASGRSSARRRPMRTREEPDDLRGDTESRDR